MSKIGIMMSDGLEEIEALTVVDLLRRADLEIDMVSVTGRNQITGSHGIKVEADVLLEEIDCSEYDMIVLPGGMPGTKKLMEHQELARILDDFYKKNKWLAAICAAPSILGVRGYLNGKKAVCYPGYEDKLTGAQVKREPVVVDGSIITSRGLGTSIPFSLTIIELLKSKEEAQAIGKAVIYSE